LERVVLPTVLSFLALTAWPPPAWRPKPELPSAGLCRDSMIHSKGEIFTRLASFGGCDSPNILCAQQQNTSRKLCRTRSRPHSSTAARARYTPHRRPSNWPVGINPCPAVDVRADGIERPATSQAQRAPSDASEPLITTRQDMFVLDSW